MARHKNNFETPRSIKVLNQIRALIEPEKKYSTSLISATVGRTNKTVGPYLHYLAALDEIYCVPSAGSALLWLKGPMPIGVIVRPAPKIQSDRYLAPRRKYGAAVQIGIPRDDFIAAFFGPAQGVPA